MSTSTRGTVRAVAIWRDRSAGRWCIWTSPASTCCMRRARCTPMGLPPAIQQCWRVGTPTALISVALGSSRSRNCCARMRRANCCHGRISGRPPIMCPRQCWHRGAWRRRWARVGKARLSGFCSGAVSAPVTACGWVASSCSFRPLSRPQP